jgi:hypothetical protein
MALAKQVPAAIAVDLQLSESLVAGVVRAVALGRAHAPGVWVALVGRW